MEDDVKNRLLASMAAGRLVVLCGAGLSMAPPSGLPSAKAVAEMCFDAYTREVDPGFDPALRGNLEGIAERFAEMKALESIFIGRLVPWQTFVRQPNAGHAAVADFLLTGAAASALSANYDILIERTAWDYGADFLASLDGDEATGRSAVHSPLLKFHGCSTRDRQSTVWTKSQLDDQTIAARIAKSRIWMAANLRQKDLLVVGFWSDWAYLNKILGDALTGASPASVTVVDLAELAQLEAKAPELWAASHAQNVGFYHVRESGAAVLEDLRKSFSKNYLRKILLAGRAAIETEIGVPCDAVWFEVPDLGSEELYGLRRDAEGIPVGKPAKAKDPGNIEVLGHFHLLLRRAGARPIATGYELNGKSVRVINGAGAYLSTLRTSFEEAPTIQGMDVIVAVGAIDLGLPANIVREGTAGSIVRPGTAGNWLDFNNARELLEI